VTRSSPRFPEGAEETLERGDPSSVGGSSAVRARVESAQTPTLIETFDIVFVVAKAYDTRWA
jgi:hypothetical protein